jgi:pimeloyl-ACP methyl ester carboxylesterase
MVDGASMQRAAGPYHRLVLHGVGHFPAREAPDAVAKALTAQLTEAFGL